MTTEEMFQLLLNEVKEMRSDIKELKANQVRLEAKVDTNHAEMIERFVNLRLDVMVINGKIDRSLADQRLHRRSTQSAIAEIQARQDQLEEEIGEIKDKLEKAS